MSCSIIDKNLIDDLSSYTLSETPQELKIIFDSKQVSLPATESIVDISQFKSLITLQPNYITEYWQPIFINTDNSQIQTKKVNRNFTAIVDKLGIENFLSFKPQFDNWTTDRNMSVDWLLTDDNFVFKPIYGLLGWIRSPKIYKLLDAPINTVFTVTTGFSATSLSGQDFDFGVGNKLVKYNSDIIINLSSSNDSNKFFNISNIKATNLIVDYTSPIPDHNVQLYISDGDLFSYFLNSSIQSRSYTKGEFNRPSLSYLSPTLWSDYQHIYNILTRNLGQQLQESQYLWLSKITSFLSTHPIRDRITQEIFSTTDIKDFLIELINIQPFSPQSEIGALNTLNKNIFTLPTFTNILNDYSYNNYRDGFINTKADLFSKLISKYSPYILINSNAALKYTGKLDSPNIYFNQVLTCHCNKLLENNVISNDMSLELSSDSDESYSLQTNFTKNQSEYDIVVKSATQTKKYNIPLYDVAKDFPLYHVDKPISFSAGPDIYIPVVAHANSCGVPQEFNGFDFAPNTNRITTAQAIQWPKYKIEQDTLTDILDLESYIAFYDIEAISYKWELISGPTNGIKLTNVDQLEVELSFTTFGKFTLQLTVTLDTLSFLDTIDIYVVNKTGCNVGLDSEGMVTFKERVPKFDPVTQQRIGSDIVDNAESYIDNDNFLIGQPSPVNFNRNRDGILENYLDYRNTDPIIIPNDRNICKVPHILELMFSKYGAISILKTNSYYNLQSRVILANDDGQRNAPGYVGRLDTTARFNKFFYDPIQSISDSPSNLTIKYTNNNTIMKLFRITLEKLRDNTTGRCKTIYQNLLYQTTTASTQVDTKGEQVTRYDRDIPGQTNVFLRYKFDPATRTAERNGDQELHAMPELSDFGIDLKPFGGRSNLFDIHVPNITITDIALPKTKTDIVKGHPIDQEPIICHLREAEIFCSSNDKYSYDASNPNIKWLKGTYHPGLGFLTNTNNQEYHNKTSSLKFNPGNKTTFVFKGPGFYSALRGNTKNASGISVSNPSYDFTKVAGGNGNSLEKLIDTKDLDDIDIHHGYRNMGGQLGRLSKDHLLYDEYSGSYGAYSHTMRGRRLSISDRIQGSNLLFSRIRNLEVKLNFLNQINLKNVAIWITFNTCAYVTDRVSPEEAGDPSDADPQAPAFKNDPFFPLTDLSANNNPIISNINWKYQALKNGKKQMDPKLFTTHTKIAQYLSDLQQYHKTQPGSYTLYLLNREHVDSNSTDTTLHFSDRFSKNLVPRNMNGDGHISPNQYVNTSNTIKLQPTLCIPDFINVDTDKYATALKNNDMFLAVNNFIKFFNQPMFMGTTTETDPPGTIPKPNSSFGVTLHIEVFDDYDMVNLDTISNLAIKTDNNPTPNKQIADSIFNSLCSWEIIVHTDTDTFADTDNLGKIHYGWEPYIPGYNFISADPAIKSKIPPTVIDAPNTRLNDFSPCYYDANIDKQITPLRRPSDLRFPSEAILLGLAALSIGIGMGGLIGLSVGFGLFMNALSAISRFLSSIRLQERQEQLARAFVKSVYTDRGYGGPDKILLDVGINKPFVYNLEAAIYKYSNTPLLRKKVRKYIKTNLVDPLKKFTVNDIKELSDLVTPNTFADTSALDLPSSPVIAQNPAEGPQGTKGLKINDDTYVKSDSLVAYENNIYVTSTGNWELLNNTNIPISTLCENNLLALNLDSLNKMSIVPGNRAYNYFNSGQYVTTDGEDRYDIVAKGKIIKNNQEYTILQFADNRPNAGSEIYLPDNINSHILVWTDYEPNKDNNNLVATSAMSHIFPKGTYGAGTPLINSSILTHQLTQNSIPTIYDIFNNQHCNVKPTNRVTIYAADTAYATMHEYDTVDPTFAYNLGVTDAPEVLQGLPEPLSHQLTAGYSYNIANIVDNNYMRKSSSFKHIKAENDSSEIKFSHLLNNIHNYGSDNFNIVELDNPTFTGISNSGYIVVENDYDVGYSIGLRSQNYGGTIPEVLDGTLKNDPDVVYDNDALSNIMSRLRYLDSKGNAEAKLYSNMSISQLTEVYESLNDDDIDCDVNNTKPGCFKRQAKDQLSRLHSEKNQLLNVLDRIGIIYSNTYNIIYNSLRSDVIPHKIIYIEYDEEQTPITIHESNDIDRYWINIDPEQQCKTSRDSSIKILVEAKYICFPTSSVVAGELGVIPTLDRDAQNICPSEAVDISNDALSFDSGGNVFTYTFSDQEINRQKQRYSDKYGIPPSAWILEPVIFPGPTVAGGGYTATRSFFIRPGTNSTDILVEVQEKYLTLSKEYFEEFIGSDNFSESFYEFAGKVKDIIPSSILNSTNLACRSRVIPRKLKKLDTHYDRFKVDFHGNLVRTLPDRGPGGPFTNVLGLWHCISTENKKYVTVPDYFKIKNEMIYRAYFGSIDNLEHVSDYEDSLDPFEWIPYEYHPPFADEQ